MLFFVRTKQFKMQLIQRYKIFQVGEDDYNLPSLDIGFEIAKYLQKEKYANNRLFKIGEFLEELVKKRAAKIPNTSWNGIILKNFNILSEPMLSINVETLFLELSKHYVLCLAWNGTWSEDNTTLFFEKSNQVALRFEVPIVPLKN
jgi:hypothetical protein